MAAARWCWSAGDNGTSAGALPLSAGSPRRSIPRNRPWGASPWKSHCWSSWRWPSRSVPSGVLCLRWACRRGRGFWKPASPRSRCNSVRAASPALPAWTPEFAAPPQRTPVEEPIPSLRRRARKRPGRQLNRPRKPRNPPRPTCRRRSSRRPRSPRAASRSARHALGGVGRRPRARARRPLPRALLDRAGPSRPRRPHRGRRALRAGADRGRRMDAPARDRLAVRRRSRRPMCRACSPPPAPRRAFATVYAAYALYGLIGPAAAFVLLGAIAVADDVRLRPARAGARRRSASSARSSSPLLVSSAEPQLWPVVLYLAFVVVRRLRRSRGCACGAGSRSPAAAGAILWTLPLIMGSGLLPAHGASPRPDGARRRSSSSPTRIAGTPDEEARPDPLATACSSPSRSSRS